MKVHEAQDVESHALLASVLDGGNWSVSRLGRLTPQGMHLWYTFEKETL